MTALLNVRMTPLVKGFTLIELLVVVLIISILAAVALPQYQKAVKRARLVEHVQFVETYRKAMDLYVLEHGFVDASQGDFDIEMEPQSDDLWWAISCSPTDEDVPANCSINSFDHDSTVGYELYSTLDSSTHQWTKECNALNKMGSYLCETLVPNGWTNQKRY